MTLSQENGPSVQTPDNDIDEEASFQAKLAENKGSNGGTTSTLPQQIGWITNGINLDYPTFEERLKRELKYVGIYMNLPKDENNPNSDDPDWVTGREDDEISAELRELQGTLKQVTKKNQKRKAQLIPLVERQLAWQEYSSILEDLDKQIDQAYVKRIRVPKKRKKHHTAASNNVNTGTTSQIAQQKAANSSLKSLLDKRQRWINKIGPLFDKPEIMKRIPNESVFKDMDQEEDEDEADVFAQNTNKDVELN
ncbi:AIF_HP2_G0051930.mRNA.1.CDS.1 [Saccharomyces cerevisiae]|nr:AIF_HP2_G0051930.mRNA.1.CDS.1 [Saccharomyces cerevisiae]CAI6794216.1 AIF_HP2_G0051930.mRNA.1.CDS.1 [Saccharomyces cerevisiae]